MTSMVIHRTGKFKHGLCGAVISIERSTVDDDEVTCQECIEKLEEICMADTKTATIHKVKEGNFNDKQEAD